MKKLIERIFGCHIFHEWRYDMYNRRTCKICDKHEWKSCYDLNWYEDNCEDYKNYVEGYKLYMKLRNEAKENCTYGNHSRMD